MKGATKDLVILVADKNIESTLKGLLTKKQWALKMRPIQYDLFVHPERDPGCLLRAHDFLKPQAARYAHALVLFDHDGCGQEHQGRLELEQQVETNLAQSGWGERAAAVVLDPELEAWVWSDSPHVDAALGWRDRSPGLRPWLVQCKLLGPGHTKPKDPKKAVEEALRRVRRPRSSSLYLELASSVSFEGCTDAAFQKLRTTLARWFPASG